jgi:antitoxin component YwqK of YwqJK toxin-antitoxin module
MRNPLATLVLTILIGLISPIALGETVGSKELVYRDGLYFKKFTNVPFTGKTTGEWQGKLKDGKRVGLWVLYWENGQLHYKVFYKNGKKDGPFKNFNQDGTLAFEGVYKNGKRIK